MDVVAANMTDDRAKAGRIPLGLDSASALSMKWSGLHDAAATVAAIAGLASPPMAPAVRNLPSVMRDAGGWRRERAEQAIEDLAALMEPGLEALLTACARGADPRPAARALWNEFLRARDALVALAPPPGSHRRSM
jgi:hypothetical protein